MDKGSDGRNFLQMTFLTRDRDGKRSATLDPDLGLKSVLAEFKNHGIEPDGFISTWNDKFHETKVPSLLLVQFMKSYESALTKSLGSLKLSDQLMKTGRMTSEEESAITAAAEEAAWSTWTGRRMKNLGFCCIENIKIKNSRHYDGADGKAGAIDVRVVWAKKPPSHPLTFDHDDYYGGGSSLVRFHEMISNLPMLLENFKNYH